MSGSKNYLIVYYLKGPGWLVHMSELPKGTEPTNEGRILWTQKGVESEVPKLHQNSQVKIVLVSEIVEVEYIPSKPAEAKIKDKN